MAARNNCAAQKKRIPLRGWPREGAPLLCRCFSAQGGKSNSPTSPRLSHPLHTRAAHLFDVPGLTHYATSKNRGTEVQAGSFTEGSAMGAPSQCASLQATVAAAAVASTSPKDS